MSIHIVDCQDKNIPLYVPQIEERVDLSPMYLSSIVGELLQWHASKLPQDVVQLLREVADVHSDVIEPTFAAPVGSEVLKLIRDGYAFGRCSISSVQNRSYEKSIFITALHAGKSTVVVFNI